MVKETLDARLLLNLQLLQTLETLFLAAVHRSYYAVVSNK